jgi:hypothetical protein
MDLTVSVYVLVILSGLLNKGDYDDHDMQLEWEEQGLRMFWRVREVL